MIKKWLHDGIIYMQPVLSAEPQLDNFQFFCVYVCLYACPSFFLYLVFLGNLQLHTLFADLWPVQDWFITPDCEISHTQCFVPWCMLAWSCPLGTYVTLPNVGFFSPQTLRPGRTITSKERAVRCIQKLCPPLSLGWHFHKPASKLPATGNSSIP